MRALDVAAPSALVDPLSPWVDPVTRGDRALAAGFWASFHGLSAFAHLVALFLSLSATLLPIPFLMTMCSDVKPVVKPPERVEMAIYEPPPPPPPEPTLLAGNGDGVAMRTCTLDKDCDDGERCVDGVCVAATDDDVKRKKKKKKKERETMALLGVLSKMPGDDSVASIFGTIESDNALGALIGTEVGDSFGYGGLGLVGTGAGGGGTGEGIGTIGLGSIGTKGGSGSGYGSGGGRSPRISVDGDFDVAPLRRILQRQMSRVRLCRLSAPVHGTVVVRERRVADVDVDEENGCVVRALRATGPVPIDGEARAAFVITP